MVAEPHRILALARVNQYFRKAISANPAFPAAIALRDRAKQARDELPPVQWPDTPGIDDDFSERLGAVPHAEAAERAHKAQMVWLTEQIGRYDSDITMCVLNDPDGLLESLNRDFQALMKDIDAAVQRLGPAHTPAEVIANNTSHAYNEVRALLQPRDALRTAQFAVVAIAAPHMLQASKSMHLDDVLASDMMIANLDEVFPQWRQPRPRNMDGTLNDLRPWPGTDAVADQVWLSTSAKPWIPTLKQLDELHAERRNRLNPSPRVIPGIHDVPINEAIRRPVHAITTTE
jgi:hypothetical protein